VSRHDAERLNDILAAFAAIADHTTRGGLDDGLVFDAVRVRLIEIGEAVRAIDPTCSPESLTFRGLMSPVCVTTSRTGTSTPLTPSCRPRSLKICPRWSPLYGAS